MEAEAVYTVYTLGFRAPPRLVHLHGPLLDWPHVLATAELRFVSFSELNPTPKSARPLDLYPWMACQLLSSFKPEHSQHIHNDH